MKVLYVATVLSHICQFHLPYLKMLKEMGIVVHVASHDNLDVKNGLQLKYADRHIEIPFERSPYSPHNITAYKRLKELVESERYDIIVCNTPVGGTLTRLAARENRKLGTRVIYIAHGFHFYKGASITNWVLYYPLEREMARLCDVVVTINEEDYEFANKHFPGKVEHIHGLGVSEERYHPVSEKDQVVMRWKEGISVDDFVVICTGELNENKDQKTLIYASAVLKNMIPNLKVLIAGNGPMEHSLREQIAKEHLEDVVKLIGYRTDLETIVPTVDVAVSCSRREGLGLNVIEAMLCRKPVVATVNRGHGELVNHGETGYLFSSGDVTSLIERVHQLYQKPEKAKTMGEAGFRKAQKYKVSSVKEEIRQILSL